MLYFAFEIIGKLKICIDFQHQHFSTAQGFSTFIFNHLIKQSHTLILSRNFAFVSEKFNSLKITPVPLRNDGIV